MNFIWEMLNRAFGRIADADGELVATTLRTLALAFTATGAALAIGVPLGVLIVERSTRLRRAAVILSNAGLGLPPVVLGVFLALLLLPGSPLGGLEWTSTIEGVWLAQLLLALPIVVALTATAVATVPAGLLDQAAALGASWPARATLAVREARVGIAAAAITALGSAVAEVGAVVIVGGNIRHQTNTLASTVLLDLSSGDPVGATAQVIVLLAVVLVLGVVLTIVQQRGVAAPRNAG